MKEQSIKKLSVLHVVDGIFPCRGGAERQAMLLATKMTELGHEVDLVALQSSEDEAIHEVMHGFNVYRLAYPKIPKVGGIIMNLRFILFLLQRRKKYDAIHLHMVESLSVIVGLLKPWLGSVTLAKVSGASEFDGGILDVNNAGPLRRIANACVGRLDYVVAVSRYTEKRLLQAGYKQSQILDIPNGVDVEQFRKATVAPQRDNGICRIGFAGRLQKVKALDVLLRAWKMGIERNALNQAKLVIAGSGSEHDALVELIQALDLEAHVEMLGFVEDMPSMLSTLDVYVQPSYQEGLPNSVVQAMSMGLPIIASEVSGNEDLVEQQHNGLLVPPGDVTALCDALIHMAANAGQRHQMGIESRKVIQQKYQLSSVLERLFSVYRRQSPVATATSPMSCTEVD